MMAEIRRIGYISPRVCVWTTQPMGEYEDSNVYPSTHTPKKAEHLIFNIVILTKRGYHTEHKTSR